MRDPLAGALCLFGATTAALGRRLVVHHTVRLVLAVPNTALTLAELAATNVVGCHSEARSLSRHDENIVIVKTARK